MKFSVRTDLAIEAAILTDCHPDTKIDGVKIENYLLNTVNVTKVKVENSKGETVIGKPKGNYVTIECEGLRTGDEEAIGDVKKVFIDELKEITNLKDNSVTLIVGLGNRYVTPDALGPEVAEAVYVTRHLFSEMPENVSDDLRSVCAIAPGVLGITGIETLEIIRGVVEKINPDCIVAIDALASRNMNRINTTIQLADTGITPGSGIGNKRMGLNRETLGVPVIAIGVPTVVDAATIANDTIELMINSFGSEQGFDEEFKKNSRFFDMENRYSLVCQILNPYVGNLIVTPKEVDSVIKDVSRVIADGINSALVSKSGNNPEK